MVAVDRQLSRNGELVPPKSATSTRTLAAPEWLMGDLAAVVDRRGVDSDSDAFLFVSRDGGPLNYTNWRTRIWVTACEKAKLPRLRFHDLRSLATTALISAGVDVKTAQTRLGHSSPQVTPGALCTHDRGERPERGECRWCDVSSTGKESSAFVGTMTGPTLNP